MSESDRRPMAIIEYILVAGILIASSFTRYKLVGMLAAIIYLLVERILRKRPKSESIFRFRDVPSGLRANWLYIVLVVLVTPTISILVGKFFVPEYFTHVLSRVTPYLNIKEMDSLFVQLLVLAFGEEIVFRGFLQGRLGKFINPWLAILLASIVFAGLHYTAGAPVVVVMDLLSVFVDSLLFGVIFKRSNNVILSTIAHFLGNSFGVFALIVFGRGII
jgi:uncharacterized protein